MNCCYFWKQTILLSSHNKLLLFQLCIHIICIVYNFKNLSTVCAQSGEQLTCGWLGLGKLCYFYCTISTVGSVTHHRWPWIEHPQYFVAGHSQLWTSFQTRIEHFQCLLGQFEDKTEPILHFVTLIFARELGQIVFTTITGHTMWTYGRNGTVLGMACCKVVCLQDPFVIYASCTLWPSVT